MLTKGGRKKRTPEFSAGQWPSLACKAEKKLADLLNAAVVFSYVTSSPSSTLTAGIVCLKFFSLRICMDHSCFLHSINSLFCKMLPYHILTAVNYWSTSASSYFTSYLARAGVIEKMTTDITLNYQKKKKTT